MTISVIIPNYNDVRIERTLNSIFSQSYSKFETIVIDGGSTNQGVLKIYKQFNIDKLIIEKDEGIFDALNKGVSLASGDLIYLLGSDDYLPLTNTFQDVIATFENKSIDGVCIGCEFVNSNGKLIRSWYPKSINSSKIGIGIFPPHFSLFLKKNIYSNIGKFQYKEFNNVACDIFWLMDLAIKIPDFKIESNLKNYLVMEYGGASTGSFNAIFKQFILVFKYSFRNSKHFPFWFILSPIRTFSKLFQFKLF